MVVRIIFFSFFFCYFGKPFSDLLALNTKSKIRSSFIVHRGFIYIYIWRYAFWLSILSRFCYPPRHTNIECMIFIRNGIDYTGVSYTGGILITSAIACNFHGFTLFTPSRRLILLLFFAYRTNVYMLLCLQWILYGQFKFVWAINHFETRRWATWMMVVAISVNESEEYWCGVKMIKWSCWWRWSQCWWWWQPRIRGRIERLAWSVSLEHIV